MELYYITCPSPEGNECHLHFPALVLKEMQRKRQTVKATIMDTSVMENRRSMCLESFSVYNHM